MATEQMMCCGALTRVYSDAGNRTHMSWCDGVIKTREELNKFVLEHQPKPVADVTFDNPITGKRVGRRFKSGRKEPI